jgi:hypothetical protein
MEATRRAIIITAYIPDPAKWEPDFVNVKGIVVLPHFWGTDELMQKLLDGIIASEAISS